MLDTLSSAQSPAAPRFSRLTPEQCARVQEASLAILERTGVRLYSAEAIELVCQAGATLSDENRVRIPRRLVERALASAPKRVVLYDRHGRPVIPLEGSRTFFGPGSDCLYIVDHRTGERRRPTLQDVVEGITLCDALEHIDFVMSMFLPADVDQELSDRYQMEVMLNRTTKPIVFVTYDFAGCVDAIAMAEAVAGGPDAFRKKPFAVCYINSTSGLRHNQEALDKLLYLAGKGLPAIYVPGGSAGLTDPVTVAGSLATKHAGALVGLVIAQLKREGTPVILPGWGSVAVDMRTLVRPYAAPDHRGTAEALAHHLDLPMFSLAGVTDTKLVDQQAAIEAALTMLADALAGGQLIHDLGYLESGLSGSLAQLAICNEIVGWIRHFTADVDLSDEALALDLVEKIGPDGQFLDSDHTHRHFREHWYPRLFERGTYDTWVAKGSRTLAERAAAQVTDLLARHQPEPLPEAIAQAVHAVVVQAKT